MAEREPVIGIDLGTTNSVVATVRDGNAVVIPNRAGSNLTPSMVAIAKTGKVLVGQMAKRQAIANAHQTVFASKRLIGRKFSSTQVQEAAKILPYSLSVGQHDDVKIELGDKAFTLPEVSAMILKELKADAEAHFGKPVRRAVITVPAYFNDGQRQATKDAGRIAGLDVLRIINEPTAAALAYGLSRKTNGKLAVFDLGGGTFDVSVLDVNKGVFDVIATGGDTYLGGEDFDQRIIEWLVFDFAKDHGTDLRKDRMALQRLKDAAEKAKIELSSAKETQINLPFISTPEKASSALHLQRSLTREKFESLCDDLIQKTIAICEQVLKEAKVTPGDLKEMLLVGGMTRVPKIQETVKGYFRRDPSKGVHPEEVVALGAAIHANSLVGSTAEPVTLLDVTPQSLGVAIAGGYRRKIIARNTTVPTSVTETFTTSKDKQTIVKIMVLQGESEVAHHNELLGEFMLTGLREGRRGDVEVDVSFDINSEGIVSVSAKDRETGLQQSIQVTASGGLTSEELQKILAEQDGQLLGTPQGEMYPAERKALEERVDALMDMVKAVEAGEDAESAAELLKKIRRTIAKSQSAAISGSLLQLNESVVSVDNATALLKGLLSKVGKADSAR